LSPLLNGLLAQQNWRLLFWPGQFYFGLGLRSSGRHGAPPRSDRSARDRLLGPDRRRPVSSSGNGLHFAGTVNQAGGWGHASAVRGMLRIIKAARWCSVRCYSFIVGNRAERGLVGTVIPAREAAVPLSVTSVTFWPKIERCHRQAFQALL